MDSCSDINFKGITHIPGHWTVVTKKPQCQQGVKKQIWYIATMNQHQSSKMLGHFLDNWRLRHHNWACGIGRAWNNLPKVTKDNTHTCVWKEVSTLIDMCMQNAWAYQDRKISKLEIHMNINIICIIKQIHLQTQNWQMQQMSRLPRAIIAKVPTNQDTFSLQIQMLKLFDSCA